MIRRFNFFNQAGPLILHAMERMRLTDPSRLSEGQTLKFQFQRNGRPVEAFLARVQGQWAAYENVCRHIAITLDYGDDRFFTRDGKHFICQSHGALYEPLTGECVAGPCVGEKLKRLKVVEEDGAVWLEGQGS